ncbi:MAG: UDP-3-O-(3-hydroxymyristoyl)glucosamine N-acyltransferase [Bacteroidota bacterium]
MEFSAYQIAELLQGTVEGDGNVFVSQLAKIEEGQAGALSFLANPKYEPHIYQTQSSICIVNRSFEASQALPVTLTLIRVEDAYSSFARLLELYAQFQKKQPSIEQPSYIDSSAQLGDNCYIGAFVYIGAHTVIGDNCAIYPGTHIGDYSQIGKDTTLFSGVQIYDNMVVGNRCVIHSGSVIGSDGFGFAPDEKRVYSKVPQIGNVVIGDDVEIGANCTIDRATIGSTTIGNGVKIDNLCQIAHNVEIGDHTAIASQAGIAGSAKLGKHIMVGGQTGINGHLTIVDHTKIVAQSGIPSSVKTADTLMGSPAISMNDFKRSFIGFRRLPEIFDEVRALRKELNELKDNKEK